jgi:hypothetical protein
MEIPRTLDPIVKSANSQNSLNNPLKAKLVVDKIMLNQNIYSLQDVDRLPKELQPKSVFTPTHGKIFFFTITPHY